MRRWWRWTWRGWVGQVIGLALVVGAMSASVMAGFVLPADFERVMFRWNEISSFIWLGWRMAIELPAVFVLAWFQFSAIRLDFPSLSGKRWIGLSLATTIVVVAIDVIVLDGLKADDGGRLPFILAYEGFDSIVLAWIVWRLVLQDHAIGGSLWVTLYGASGILSTAAIQLARRYSDGPDSALPGIIALSVPFLITPFIGIAVARFRQRHTSLERVFA